MLAKRPRAGRVLAAVVVAWCLAVAVMSPAAADPEDDQAFVKYYRVATVQDKAENLTEIAVKFLGSGARSADIYNLNVGRVQPDGATLTDPAKLRAGWFLVLPWDAVGDGVQYGQLPAEPTPRPSSPKPKPKPTGRPGVTVGPDGPPTLTNPPNTGVRPSLSPTLTPSPRPTSGCTTAAGSSGRSDWAQLRMAVDGAWEVSRGNGVMVAIVDSGVDGGLDQLDGRLSPGADVTVGNGKGNVDCLGTGTAMASIVAASASSARTPVGVAPDATILPVRVVGNAPTAKPADAANAIEVAVSAEASVLALGSYVDLSAPEVAAALTVALNHDVIVVAGAPTKEISLPKATEPSATGALLLVGGVDADNKLVERYHADSVEVVAPGADVASIGPGKSGTLSYTGTRFAVAFVAGEAALIRSAYPELNATEVEGRITGSAKAVESASPDGGHGKGIIDPAASVTQAQASAPPAEPGGDTAAGGGRRDDGDSRAGVAAFVCFGIALIAGGLGVAFWLRRRNAG